MKKFALILVCIAISTASFADYTISNPGVSHAWTSTYNAGWGGSATRSNPVTGGAVDNGGFFRMVGTGNNSSGNVLQAPITSGQTGNVKGYMRRSDNCQSHWMEYAYRLGTYTAENFDQEGASWTLIQKFDAWGLGCGNGNTWTEYQLAVSAGANTVISLGAKYGNGTDAADWDEWVIQTPLEIEDWMLY